MPLVDYTGRASGASAMSRRYAARVGAVPASRDTNVVTSLKFLGSSGEIRRRCDHIGRKSVTEFCLRADGFEQVERSALLAIRRRGDREGWCWRAPESAEI
jgi:hypothetical protein